MKRGDVLRLMVIGCFLIFPSARSQGLSLIAQRREQIREYEREMIGTEGTVEPDKNFSVQQYMVLGLRRNPGLKSAFDQWQASFQQVSQAFSLPDPRFTYEKETRSGAREDSYTISQTIPFPEKLWIRRNRAFYDSEVAYQQFIKTRLELKTKISEAFYEYAYLSKRIFVIKEHLRLLRELERTAQSRYATGELGNQHLLKVQLEVARLENDLFSAKDHLKPVQARLNSLLNMPDHQTLPQPRDPFSEVETDELYQKVEGLMDILKENNPALLALDQKVRREQQNLRLAKREYLPDLTVGLTKGNAMGSMNADNESLMVMVSINIPLWAGSIRAGIKEAEAGLSSFQRSKEEKENELFWELTMAHYKLRDFRRQVRLHEDQLIPKAAQTFNASKAAYETKAIDFQSLIDSQRVLLNLKNAFYRYNADYHKQAYVMQALLGAVGQKDAGFEEY